eukprot:TRINITY_DN1345_c0_g1_i1.p1 TRINITY_DN1345_c0_g1~~TRINITY_DN1345_c0_g1_i1.p1  ORF type:complete len:590 (-),score=99.07 TRINITY_DN1345_c0_g1_i1:10-1530(-)
MKRCLRRSVMCKFTAPYIRKHPRYFILGLIALAVFAIVFTLASEGLCVAERPYMISTRMSRRLVSGEDITLPCEGKYGRPCNVFLSLAPRNDTTSGMIFNFHTKVEPMFMANSTLTSFPNGEPVYATVFYDTTDHDDHDLSKYQFVQQGTSFTYSTLDFTKYIHRVQVRELQPDTVYYFRVGILSKKYRADNYSAEYMNEFFSPQRKFKSLPADSGDFVFVAGGDVGLRGESYAVAAALANQNPQAVLVGGDMAYANDMPTCYRRWDAWLAFWQQMMVSAEGMVLPIVPAVGNHEAGWGMSKRDVAFYFRYFTGWYQDQEVQDNGMQGQGHLYNSSESYEYYQVGDDALLMTLDSGMISSIGGDQLDWMKTVLRENGARKKKIALYHEPVYELYNGTALRVNDEMQDSWVPLFEEFNLTIALENHDHLYRRVKTGILQRDILFIGGGAWGVEVTELEENLDINSLIEKYALKNNFLRLNVSSTQIDVVAYDDFSNVIDKVRANIEN